MASANPAEAIVFIAWMRLPEFIQHLVASFQAICAESQSLSFSSPRRVSSVTGTRGSLNTSL